MKEVLLTTSHSVPLTVPTVATDQLGPFRFGSFLDGVLLTNDQGKWHWLPQDVFTQFITGALESESAELKTLGSKGFVRSELQLDDYIATVRQRKKFLGEGPQKHQIWLDDQHGSLPIDTAKSIIDHLMQSTTQTITIEVIQRSAPIDAELLSFLLSYTSEKNRYESKVLKWGFRSPFFAVTEEILNILIEHNFTIYGELDSTKLLQTTETNSNDGTMKDNLLKLKAMATALQKSVPEIQIRLLVDQEHVRRSDDILQALHELGTNIVLLEPQQDANRAPSITAFKELFRATLQALLSDKYTITEGHARALAGSVLQHSKAPAVGYRSPSDAGTGIHCYNTKGQIFPNMQASKSGNTMFLLGQTEESNYQDVLQHATVKTLAVASLVDCLPGFSEHWSAPFLTVDPIAAYLETGDLFEKMPTSSRVKADIARLEVIFGILLQSDDTIRNALAEWPTEQQ